ncbi:MAG TPA: metallophosphoesterase, partial [Rhizobiales bacterium]|nr:metallophosphoesterase [Hyphomicrobiales bacterium]
MRESSKHHAMVRWYSPALLARTGMRAAISTAVGQVADNREVRAALYPDPPLFDHSGDVGADGNFRLDFVADLGDGWDATFAVASAICADTQMTNDGEAPRGDVLIMGGDEIYPEPSVDGYCERTVAPWNAAGCENGDFSTTLYAIPGNHDWYDGLHAFGDVFCRQGRPFPGFEAARFSHLKPRQANSYFALKLPHGWWLCGIDIQLNNRIDPPQYDFFESVAKKISKGEQIILCAPTPSWVRETSGNPGASKLLATMMQVLSAGGGEIRLVLTGDLHHYSRYESADRRLTLITAGGGGAFLHPTHKLPAKAKIGKRGGPAREFSKVECYPLPEVSQKLAWRNLLFPFYNPDFALTLGAIYVLLSWFLVTRQIGGNAALTSLFTDIYSGTHKIGDTVVQFFDAIPKSPEFAIFVTAFTAAFIAFNLTRNVAARIGFGVLHTLAHIMAL